MKHFIPLAFLFLVSCSNSPSQPATSDTAWRFVFVNDHWETLVTAGRYFDTSAIVKNEIKTVRDSAFKVYVLLPAKDSLTKPVYDWVVAPKDVVGIKLKD